MRAISKDTGMGARLSLLCAVISLAGSAVYLIYGIVYDYLDPVVLAVLLLGALCAAGNGLRERAALGLLDLAASVCLSYGIGLFFLNSFPVWADELNGITMYASRGGLGPVIAILIVLFLAVSLAISSCFMKKGGNAA